ncbi:penicillin-binding protein 2 [Streptomyces sp. JJ36]|uniref:peptidoglycan D,D-transpeptidase FtsI family protein n=1 Tax=Streptomyces sp. JJ36 TaxID=2736645 RepID=UPI001F3976BE|nr:penicillin-binding protein 2 [Streptomyces sp. JJ36]MCF6523022.1 penicillin-binding protein 2 [Streptomyces sp. JJ36]
MSERPRPPRRVPRPARSRPARERGTPERTSREGAPRGRTARSAAARTVRDRAGGTARGSAGPAARRTGAGRSHPAGPGRPLRLARARPRLRLIGILITVVALVFTGRLLQVQAVDADAYAAKAAVNRYITVPLAAERGTMSARDGAPLATTVDAYDITADPYLFTREQTGVRDAPARAADLLAPVLGTGRKELSRKLARKNTRYVLLARQRTPQTWRQIKDLKGALADKAANGDGHNVLAGVYAEEHAKRVYPNNELAAGVLGFVNAAGEGGGGLEAKLQETLAGEDGKITYAQSAGRQVPTAGEREQPAVPGSDVRLTLDRDIQWAAQRAITEQVRESEADGGYVVVQDPGTGELLALANAPGFDPNHIRRADSATLGNGALQDAYEPGSTAKVMSMAAVLEENVATPRTRVTVPNRLPRADRAFADDVDHPTWYLTLNGVLAKSSNIGTILATEQLGETRKEANRVLHSYLRKFGLGRPTGLGFPGETPGLLAAPEDWSASQQYTIPFGQGVSLNAVQAASIYSTVANGGVRLEPTLVRGTTGPDGRFTAAPAPDERRVVGTRTARTLSRMLESVVASDEGTGSPARIPGYRVAGKTGTANRVDPETGRYRGYTASFAGFAPADKPRVTVYCAVQNPRKGSYFGSDVCGPVFKEVMEFSLKSLQVPPTGETADPLPVTFDPDAPRQDGRRDGTPDPNERSGAARENDH